MAPILYSIRAGHFEVSHLEVTEQLEMGIVNRDQQVFTWSRRLMLKHLDEFQNQNWDYVEIMPCPWMQWEGQSLPN